jgi:putative oxidoreductase
MKMQGAVQFTVFLLRVVSGLLLFQAGGLKLFGWFGGMPPGVELSTLLVVAAWLEVFGGAAIILGILTRPIAFVLSGEMAFAYFIGHSPQGFWPIQNHGEPAVLLCFIFLFFAAYGAGEWSADAFLHRKRETGSNVAKGLLTIGG